VDAANVMGSRPDGWWRDRAGAARRLCDQIGELALTGVRGLPASLPVPAIDQWFPQFVVVLEGAAAAMPDSSDSREDGQPRIVRARGSGDDEIVRQAAGIGGPRLVVTADRELRSRCEAVGSSVVGPGWLLGLL
jgi:8-oxo-dGTP diphosphatase